MTRSSARRGATPARILVIDHTAELAGGELALAKLLSAIDRERFEVRVLLLADGPLVARLRADGIRVAVLPASSSLTGTGRAEAASSPRALLTSAVRTLALLPRLTSAIRGAHVELVVANTLKAAVLTSMAAPLAGRRWVWHLHDRIASDYLPAPLVVALRLLARLGPRIVVANSRATRQTLPGLPDERIPVAYPGLDTEVAAPDRHPPAHSSFGLLGRIAPTKGQLEFLRAAALLTESLPDARFSVIGDAMFNDVAFAERVRALPKELGIEGSVEFTGWAADPVAAIADLTALIHASPVPEPFGQVIVEAMLAGVPVIGSNSGGVPEILDPDGDGEPVAPGVIRTPLGLLAAPGDPVALASAMAWMAEHDQERAELAARARVSATERFDIRAGARITRQAWTLALGSSEPEPRSRIVDGSSATQAGAS